MISVNTKAFLHKSQTIKFKMPENIKLKSGEYEIIVVINTTPITNTKNRILSFSEHDYFLENPNISYSRSDIYGENER